MAQGGLVALLYLSTGFRVAGHGEVSAFSEIGKVLFLMSPTVVYTWKNEQQISHAYTSMQHCSAIDFNALKRSVRNDDGGITYGDLFSENKEVGPDYSTKLAARYSVFFN